MAMKKEENQRFTYLAVCRFKPGSEDERLLIRPKHRQFIDRHAQQITWGGLLEKEGLAYGYCLLIATESIAEAESLIGEDPYFIIIEQLELFNFLQRVPLQEI
jgi:uncharacterized protein YciI